MLTTLGFKRQIAKQARAWADKEIISEPQAEQICAEYDIDYHNPENKAFGFNLLVILGVLFLALSLITLIGANWDSIPRALRMTALIILTLAVQGIGLRFYLQRDFTVARNFFFLGNFCFGAGIVLIAQIYHLGEHMPDGIFIWALGCLPFALLMSSALLSLQTMILAMIWFYTESTMGFYPALFPLFILASIWVLHKEGQGKLLFNAIVISIVVWIEYSLAWYWDNGDFYNFHAEHLAVTTSLVAFTYFFGQWFVKRPSLAFQDYGASLLNWSTRVALLAGLALSFDESWDALQGVELDFLASMLIACFGLTTAAGWFALQSDKLIEFIVVQFSILFIVGAVVLTNSSGAAIALQVITNLVLVAIGITLIIRGIELGESKNFFSGVGLILIVALLRYIDLVGNYVGGAALFMVFALIMLGSAWGWKRIQARSVGVES